MHEVLVNRVGGISLPRKSVVRLVDCPDMTLDVYRGRKTTIQQQYKTLSYSEIDTVFFVHVPHFLFIYLFKDCLPCLFHGFRNKHFNKISLDSMLYFHNELYKF